MKLAVLLAVFALAFTAQTEATRRVCYYASWAIYRQGEGHFEPSYIDPNLCTHVIYTFLGVSEEDGHVTFLDSYTDIGDEWHEGQIPQLKKLKDQNPNLKLMMAAGGWNFGTRVFSLVAADPAKRQNFANTAAETVIKYGFDGFDIDWEYPNVGEGSRPQDLQNMVEMLKVFRQRFDQNGLLLSIATNSAPDKVDISFNIPAIAQVVDFINVMAYDLHGSWEPVTGHNAPIRYGSYLDSHPDQAKNLYINAIVDKFLSEAPAQKLNLGVPLYARTFSLADPNNNGFGAPTTGPGIAGAWYNEGGNFPYGEICALQKQGRWRETFDQEQGVPYAVEGNQWAGYDNVQSILAKADIIKSKNIGGVMVWSIETDDRNGVCTGTKFPLLTALKNALP